jgi:hypothetical protein
MASDPSSPVALDQVACLEALMVVVHVLMILGLPFLFQSHHMEFLLSVKSTVRRITFCHQTGESKQVKKERLKKQAEVRKDVECALVSYKLVLLFMWTGEALFSDHVCLYYITRHDHRG